MRNRKEIENDSKYYTKEYKTIIEVLLDIREILNNKTPLRWEKSYDR